MAQHIQFIECSSLNISLDLFGYATLTYTLISNTLDIELITDFKGVTGYPTSIRQEPIIDVGQYYSTHVTIKGTKNS